MKTRNDTVDTSAGDVETEGVLAPADVGFVAGPSPEVWIFDGIDSGTAPYEIDLPHPRTEQLNTFALGLKDGAPFVGEIKVFKPQTPASFLTVIENVTGKEGSGGDSHDVLAKQQQALIGGGAIRFVAEIDPIFLLLPILASSKITTSKDNEPRNVFRPFDDLMEIWNDRSRHVSRLVYEGYKFESDTKIATSMSDSLRKAMELCCDTFTAAGETMFRFSEDKFFNIVLSKSKRMVSAGLPPSLEKLATRTVAPPAAVTAKLEEDERESRKTSTPGPGEDADDSQVSQTDSIFSLPAGSDKAADQETTSTPSQSSASPSLDLMRLRLAFDFILTNYVPPRLSRDLLVRLDKASLSPSRVDLDFKSLRQHLEEIARQKSAIARLHQTSFSRKRGFDEDERAEAAAEKRRKREEEDKKKKSESFGMKQLKKVDTTGMKKLSAFFAPKPKAK